MLFVVNVICKKNELLRKVLERYCLKICEKKEDFIFVFNSLKLREDKTVQELGLINGSIILVIDKTWVGG